MTPIVLSLLGGVTMLGGAAPQSYYEVPPVEFSKTQICIGELTKAYTVEVAADNHQRARGLMERDSLPEDQGMWFQYPSERPGSSGFWMYNTNIPLDIAYLDGEGQIVKIMQMQPCKYQNPGLCRSYRPEVNYSGALEMNLNFFQEHGVELGDHIREATSGSCPNN